MQCYLNGYVVRGSYSRAVATESVEEPLGGQLGDRGAHERRATEQRVVLRML